MKKFLRIGFSWVTLLLVGLTFTSCRENRQSDVLEEEFSYRMMKLLGDLDMEVLAMTSTGRHLEPFPHYVDVVIRKNVRDKRNASRFNFVIQGEAQYEVAFYSLDSKVGFVEIRYLPGSSHGDLDVFLENLGKAFPMLPLEARTDGFVFDLRRPRDEVEGF